jgi:uncharacterized protein (DUF1330 family)
MQRLFACAWLVGTILLCSAPAPAGEPASEVQAAPGYLVFRASFHDAEALAAYGRAVAALAGEFGGRFVVVSSAPELMEGEDDGRRLVILRFPTVATAREFWNSAAYTEVKRLREGAGQVDAVLVAGIPENP